MSAFLGPIHVKMYERILYQDKLAQAVMEQSAQNPVAEVDAKFPPAKDGPLEELIDQGNIHGWLSEAVANCEQRFALAVCKALGGQPDEMGTLCDTVTKLGRAYPLGAAHDAEAVFQAVHNILLDGMPCDFPFTMLESSTEMVRWRVTNCPHARYWGGDAERYYLLRDAWMSGVLEGSGVCHTRHGDGEHTLRKER